jgi:hypothetical protein
MISTWNSQLFYGGIDGTKPRGYDIFQREHFHREIHYDFSTWYPRDFSHWGKFFVSTSSKPLLEPRARFEPRT